MKIITISPIRKTSKAFTAGALYDILPSAAGAGPDSTTYDETSRLKTGSLKLGEMLLSILLNLIY